MAQKIKGEKSKEHLVECSARLFLKNGYNATGINQILSEAGMTKGSFYFYFTSKKELAIEVAKYYNNKILNWIFDASVGRKWEAFAAEVTNILIGRAANKEIFGCPIAVLGMETAFMEPDVTTTYYNSLLNLRNLFKDVIERTGYSGQDAELLADRAFALYEGYLLLYRVSKDARDLEKLSRDLKEIVPEL